MRAEADAPASRAPSPQRLGAATVRGAGHRARAVDRALLSPLPVTTRARPRWIGGLLGLTCGLNVLDVFATLAFVESGVAAEANPIMAALLELGPAPFALSKIAIVTSCAWVLWRFAGHELARLGSVVVCSAYAMLAMLHLGWMRALPG